MMSPRVILYSMRRKTWDLDPAQTNKAFVPVGFEPLTGRLGWPSRTHPTTVERAILQAMVSTQVEINHHYTILQKQKQGEANP